MQLHVVLIGGNEIIYLNTTKHRTPLYPSFTGRVAEGPISSNIVNTARTNTDGFGHVRNEICPSKPSVIRVIRIYA